MPLNVYMASSLMAEVTVMVSSAPFSMTDAQSILGSYFSSPHPPHKGGEGTGRFMWGWGFSF